MIIASAGQSAQELEGSMDDLRAFALTQLAELKPEMVVTGIQPGWDHALAGMAIELGIDLQIIIPYQGFEKKYSSGLQKKIEALINDALIVSWWPNQGHTEIYADRDIVTHADTLIVLSRPGVEHDRIRLARERNMRVIDCWPEWLETR